MSNKLYIIDISKEAAQIAAKTSKFSGAHFARFILTSVDEATNKMTNEVFVGDTLTVLRNIALSKLNGKQIALGNFKVTLKTINNTLKNINELKADTLANVIQIDVHGDGNNSLAKLADCTHIAIANVIGKRGTKEIEYGCVVCDKNGQSQMMSWKNLQNAIMSGQYKVHNIAVRTDSRTGDISFVRTNISYLDTIYLKVDVDVTKTTTTSQTNKQLKNEKEQATKNKLLAQLTQTKSPLMYSLTDDYDLSALQYILKIHFQNEPVNYMMNADYTVEQLRLLHRAYKNGIDVAIIADPRISAKTMEGVIKKFEYNLWDCIDLANLRK